MGVLHIQAHNTQRSLDATYILSDATITRDTSRGREVGAGRGQGRRKGTMVKVEKEEKGRGWEGLREGGEEGKSRA